MVRPRTLALEITIDTPTLIFKLQGSHRVNNNCNQIDTSVPCQSYSEMDGYTVDQLVSLAKCCEITERYDEMKEVKSLIT